MMKHTLRITLASLALWVFAQTAGAADIENPVDLESTNAPSAIVAAAPNAIRERVIAVCTPMTMNETATLVTGEVARWHFLRNGEEMPDVSNDDISIIRQPEHGQLVFSERNRIVQLYYPDENYLGKDYFEALVSTDKGTVRVLRYFVIQTKAIDQLESFEVEKLCPKGDSWIISAPRQWNWGTLARRGGIMRIALRNH
jgi:hypothetical protein